MKSYRDMTWLELFAVAAHSAVALNSEIVPEIVQMHKDVIDEVCERSGVGEPTVPLMEEQWAAVGKEVREIWEAAVKAHAMEGKSGLLQALMGAVEEIMAESDRDDEKDFAALLGARLRKAAEAEGNYTPEGNVELKIANEAELDSIPESVRPQVADAFERMARKVRGELPRTTASAGAIELDFHYLYNVVTDDDDALEALATIKAHIEELSHGAVVVGSLTPIVGESFGCQSRCCDAPTNVHVSAEGGAFFLTHKGNEVPPIQLPDDVRFYRFVAEE